VEVHVERRAALDEVEVLNDEEAAVGFAGEDLEEDGAIAAGVFFTEAVFAGGDQVGRSGRWHGELGEGERGEVGGEKSDG